MAARGQLFLALAVLGGALLPFVRQAEAASDKYIVMLDIEGERSPRLKKSIARMVKEQYKVMEGSSYRDAARRLRAEKLTPTNVKKVCGYLEVDGVIDGTLVKEDGRYKFTLRLRSAVTGAIAKKIPMYINQPSLSQNMADQLEERLLAAIADLPRQGGGTKVKAKGRADDEDDEADEEETSFVKKKKGKKSKAAADEDDDEDAEDEAPRKMSKAEKRAAEKKAKAAALAEKKEREREAKEEAAREAREKKEREKAEKEMARKKKKKARDEDEEADDDEGDADDEEVAVKSKKGQKGQTGKKDKQKKVAAKDDDEDDDGDDPTASDDEAADDEDEPKRAAMRDAGEQEQDEDDASNPDLGLEASADSDQPKKASGVRTTPLLVNAGMSFVGRNLSFKSSAPAEQAPRGYQGKTVPGVYATGELYPMTFAGAKGALGNIGVGFVADRVIKLNSSVSDGMDGTALLPTKQSRYGLNLRYRHNFGDGPRGVSLLASVGYNKLTFSIDKSGAPENVIVDVPNTSYSYVDPGLGVRVPVAGPLSALIEGKFLAVLGTGEIQEPEQYGAATVTGFDGDAGLEYAIGDHFLARAGARLIYVGYKFKGNGAQSDRDGNGSADVGGASDRYLGGYLTAGYAF
jgi:hypothetical protein